MKIVFGIAVMILLFSIAEGVQSIEKKLDAMNTCGPAEVVVSGEGE